MGDAARVVAMNFGLPENAAAEDVLSCAKPIENEVHAAHRADNLFLLGLSKPKNEAKLLIKDLHTYLVWAQDASGIAELQHAILRGQVLWLDDLLIRTSKLVCGPALSDDVVDVRAYVAHLALRTCAQLGSYFQDGAEISVYGRYFIDRWLQRLAPAVLSDDARSDESLRLARGTGLCGFIPGPFLKPARFLFKRMIENYGGKPHPETADAERLRKRKREEEGTAEEGTADPELFAGFFEPPRKKIYVVE